MNLKLLFDRGCEIIFVEKVRSDEMTSTKTNYHSALKNVAEIFDPPIAQMRLHFQRESSLQKWPVHLLLLQFKDIAKLTKVFKDIKNINFSAIPLIGTALPAIVTLINSELNNWVIAGGSIGLYIFLFLCGIPYYFLKMISIEEKEYFHIGAYRKFCSTEYKAFSRFLNEDNLSFGGLYDYVTGVLTKQADELKIVEIVTKQYNLEKEELRRENKEIREKGEKSEQLIVDYYNDLINELNEEIGVTETGLRYLNELLADITNVMYRMVNNCFGVSDLKILSGITLYKLDGDMLFKLADEGTSGSNPNRIEVNEENAQRYSMLAVLDKDNHSPKKNQPRDGYYIISHKMKMQKENHKVDTWIINFHVNKELNNKAWQLLLDYDIISNKEVYRIFHALCLFLYTNTGTKKEVVDDVSTKGTS